MAEKKSQIYEVAERAGVSIATVSRVINQIKVRPRSMKAVLAAMEELNYVPNEIARGLARNSAGMIGLYMTAASLSIFDSKYALEILRGIESVVSESSYSIVIVSEKEGGQGSTEEPKYLEFVRKKKIDGLILNGMDKEFRGYATFKTLLGEGYPIAFFGKRTAEGGFNVYAQFAEYMYRMLGKFRDHGHRKILAMTMDLPVHGYWFEEVVERFSSAFPGALDIEIYRMPVTSDSSEILARVDSAVVQGGCSGLFVEQLNLLPRILGYLHSKQVRVPEDLSVISIEHQKNGGEAYYPKIDCFFVPAFEMGAAAARLLISFLEKKDLDTDTVQFCPEYYERGSVKKLQA